MFNWLVAILPTWFPWFIILVSIIGYFVLVVLEMCRVLNLGLRLLGRIIVLALLVSGLYVKGRQDAISFAKEEVAKTVVAQQAVTKKVETDYIKKLNEVKGKNDVIYKTVTTKDDSMCNLPKSFVELHNSAAQAAVPDTTKRTDGSSSGVALSTAEQTVVENYGLYHQIAEQLKALQYWVDEQRKLH